MLQARRVAVIGGGPSGLASAKSLLEEGIEPVLFEQNDNIGGVWLYKDVPDPTNPQTLHASCYKSLTTNSSRDMTAFSDFPFPFQTSTNCPTHVEIVKYLHMYTKTFNIEPHIRFNTKVVRVERDGDRWLLTSVPAQHSGEAGKTPVPFMIESFDGVMVCTGMFWDPVVPRFKGEEHFRGPRFHSHYYRTPDAFRGKNVLLIGIGNSALDISADLAEVANSVTISCRSGSIMIPIDDREGKAVDQQMLSRKRQKMTSEERVGFFKRLTFDTTSAFVKYGMPIPAKVPEQSHYSILKKNEAYLEHLKAGRIRIKHEVLEIQPDQTILFKQPPQRPSKDQGQPPTQQQDVERFDAIIYCTGYAMRFPFLDQSLVPLVKDLNLLGLYKRVLHPQYPTLAFISQIDTIGSLFNVGEMQARWVSKIWAGHTECPSLEERLESVEAMKERIRKEKPRYPHFINFPAYMDDLAQMIGCHPSPEENARVSEDTQVQQKVTRLLQEGPLLPVTFSLSGYKKWNGAVNSIAKL